jgi:hypothetical protein
LFGGQRLRLLLEQGRQGALGQATGGNGRDLFEFGEIDLESRATVTVGAAGDDFAPLGGQVTEIDEVLRC